MCGVPYHAAEGYIAKLLRRGFRVAICEQMEEPGAGKKIVRREVTRVLTPGTAVDPTHEATQANLLCAVSAQGDAVGLAWLDLSTGDFQATEFRGTGAASACAEELARLGAREILLASDFDAPEAATITHHEGALTTALEPWVFTAEYAVPLLLRQLGAKSLAGFDLEQRQAAACAAGAVLHYVEKTQHGGLAHLAGLRIYERVDCLQMDATAVRNLELVEPLFSGDASGQTTLFKTLDACLTAMGKRMLRAAMLRPLVGQAAINARLDAVAELHRDLRKREDLRAALHGIQDQERLLARISLESAGPRDLLGLAQSLERSAEGIAQALTLESAHWRTALDGLKPHSDLCAQVTRTIAADCAAKIDEGGFIAPGVHAELDELRELSRSGRQTIAAMEERERKRTGIGSLKVRFNSVFGYYIEISKANLQHAPADYERKQTLVNAERFTTPELKEYEVKILSAQERSVAIEKQLFAELRAAVLAESAAIRATSAAIAMIDMLACFAHLAALRNYVRPDIDESGVLEAIGSRHPVIERLVEEQGGRFVANAIYLDADAQPIALITGPNMGGKSTYLRQAALLVVMAQMGSFVPAESMRLGVVDRIYTRIGAADNVARGQSTFMVEMTETASILNTATPRSLLLLDEMGRGTATFDGLSLAWATLEHLHANIRARTLFATHYQELTLLAEQLDGLRNLHVSCREGESGIVFLHTVEPGAASKSYGIEVARLAGLPASVVRRAREVLRRHERSERSTVAAEANAPVQMTIFTPLSQRVADRLKEADVNALTPVQALNLLADLKSEIEGEQS
jgi:DNA mismatch repair protein MutS